MNFGETIKRLRKELRFTQRELAEKLNVNYTYISKIENNKLEAPPSQELIRKMAEILDTDPNSLLDLAGKLDLKRLQQIASETPEAGTVLRRIQETNLSDEQWREIGRIVDDEG